MRVICKIVPRMLRQTMHCKNNYIWCQIRSKWARQGQRQGYGRKKFTINIEHLLSFIFSAAQFSLKTLYCSLVRSNLEHCSVVWCPFTKRNKDKLERIQGGATGFILRSNEQHYVRLSKLNLLTLEQICFISTSRFCFIRFFLVI